MAAVGQNVSDSWPKWQVALGIGVPTVLGLAGVWYFMRRKNIQRSQALQEVLDSEVSKPTKSATKTPEDEVLSPAEKAQNWKSKGNKFFKGEKFDKAIECYTEAIAVCPVENKSEIATFYQNRAAAYDKLNNSDAVINDTTEALKHNSRYVKALFRRAKAYETKGGENFLLALEDITAVCILEAFANPSSLEMAERVLTQAATLRAKEAFANRIPCYPSDHFITSYFMAFCNDPAIIEAEKMNSSSSAQNTDEKYTEETPEKELMQQQNDNNIETAASELSPYRQALVSLKDKRYRDILGLCTKQIDADESRGSAGHVAEARLLRASFYLLRGESEKATRDFDALLKMKDVSKQVRCNALIKRGSLIMQNGKETEALSDFAAAVREDQDNSDIYHHRGQLNLLMNRVDEAVKDFSRSVQLQPNFPIAQVQKIYTEYRQAQMLHSTLQLSASMKNFEQAIAKFPDCAEGYALYGQALTDQQQYDEADNNFKKAIELEPENGNNYVHRGLLRLQWKQDIEESIKFLETALKVDDKCGFAYETLGTIEVQRGNLDKAIELFGKALKLARTEIEMMVLYKMHEAATAQKSLATKTGILAPNLAGAGMV